MCDGGCGTDIFGNTISCVTSSTHPLNSIAESWFLVFICILILLIIYLLCRKIFKIIREVKQK